MTPRRLNAAFCCLLAVTAHLALPVSLYGQTPEIKFDRLSLEHGLSQSSVYSICQDHKGFMWFGTEDGLNLYDGYSFKIKRNDPQDPGSLSDNTVYAIYEDRSGTLWVGTWGGGLNAYDRERDAFRSYQHDSAEPTSLSHNTVRAILEDRTGSLWIGTELGGLNRFDRTREIFERYQHDPNDPHSLSDNAVRALWEDRSGNLWIGTDGGGLDRFDRRARNFSHYRHDPEDPDSLSSDLVQALYEDQAGVLWIGTWGGGLNRYERASDSFSHFRHDPRDPESLGSDKVHAVFEDRSGVLWIGTDGGGLTRFDAERRTFERHEHDPDDPGSLSYNIVLSIYEDRSGLIWVGTEGGGVNKFDLRGRNFFHYKNHPTDRNSLNDNMTQSILVDRSGILWIGTWEGGLNRFDRENHVFTHYRADPDDPDSLDNDTINALYEDRSGTLWVGTDGGSLHRYDGKGAFTRYSHDAANTHSPNGYPVTHLMEDKVGAFWIGTLGGGLDRLDRKRWTFEHFRKDPQDPGSLSDDTIWYIYEDRSGQLWIGTEIGGLDKLDEETGIFEHFDHDPNDPHSLSSNTVQAIYEDRSGTLWVGTYGGGLNKFDSDAGAFMAFREKDGLPNDVIYAILEDRNGFLWLSTNKGLSRFDPRTESFKNYDVTDGLQSNEFNAGVFAMAADGEMFFGGINGFNSFYPDRILANPYVPPIVLTSFKSINETQKPAVASSELQEIELSHREYAFSLEFAALDYHAPQKNRYAYKLEGFNDDWVKLGTKRDITFTNLDPGSYTFRVRGSNNDGVWNEEGLAVRVTIARPYWKTWWFRGAGVLVLAAAIAGAYLLRTRDIRAHNRQLREVNARLNKQIEERRRAEEELEGRNAELERFTYTVSHDLKTPLVTIKGFTGLLQQDVRRGDAERVEDDLGRISAAADNMHRLLEELLELSRIGRVVNPAQSVPMTALAREAVELCSETLAGNRVEAEVTPNLPTVVGDRARLLEVLQNLIENAARFMGDQPRPAIEVGARQEDGETAFYVRDNGIGIDARYHEKIFGLFERLNADDEGTGIGLALVKRIVELHGGRIWVESGGQGQGSTFFFTLDTAGLGAAGCGAPGR